jgi:hypothetical protein
MDLIATRSFRNIPFKDFGRITVPNALHDDHVHKGALFSIGAGKTLQAMRKTERPAAELVAALFLARVVEEPTPEVVARVEFELEQERKREKNAKAIDDAAKLSAVGAQFQELLARLSQISPGQAQPAPATRR